MKKKHIDKLFIGLFCLLIFSPTVLILLGDKLNFNFQAPIEPNNNELNKEVREAFPWPDIELLHDDFVDYTAAINGFLEDRYHLLFNEKLLTSYAQIYYKLFGKSTRGNVTIGTDGWLYLASTISDTIYEPENYEVRSRSWVDNIKSIKALANQMNASFYVLIAPNKNRVYPEYVPRQLSHQSAISMMSEIEKLLEQEGINTINLLPELLAHKQKSDVLLYSKSDSHWTSYGSYVGYQSIINHLNKIENLKIPMVAEDLLSENMRQNFSGDLATMLKLNKQFEEDIIQLNNPYQRFDSSEAGKELLIYGDSFNGSLSMFWNYSFYNVNRPHHNWGRPDIGLIEQHRPDIVIYQIVERGLTQPFRL